MKWLHVIRSVDPRGGGPIAGIGMIHAEMKRRGHHIEVASLDDPTAAFIKEHHFTVHALGPSIGLYGYNRRFVRWLTQNCTAYDLVIVDGLWQYHGFATWRALAGTGVDYLVFAHGMLDPWFKLRYPFKHLKKSLYWRLAEFRLLRDARAVLFTTEEERLLAQECFPGYKGIEHVVGYGIARPPDDSKKLASEFLNSFPELKDKRLLLFLGRIHEKKGCDLLVEAFAGLKNCPKLHLVMAGPDQSGWRAELERRCKQLAIGNQVTWTGMLTGSLKWGAYYAADFSCLPSHQENFGVSVAESLAAGTPVLISNKVNIWRAIKEGSCGIVADDNLMGTKDLLAQWLETTEAERSKMSSAARSCFEDNFYIGRMIDNLLAIAPSRPNGA